MAIIWADFPSGQRGLYGTNTANMLNGVYAEVLKADLVADPDPAIGAAGVVLRVHEGELSTESRGIRFAYPIPRKTQGLSIRVWCSALPAQNDRVPIISFRDGANAVLMCMRILSTGAIEFRSVDTNGGTLYGTTVGPVLTANAYAHLEMKMFSDAAAGTITLKVNGQTKATLVGLNTNGADIAQVLVGTRTDAGAGPGMIPYYKDLVLWDTSGTEGNDFQGSVAVHDLYMNADQSLNWTPSAGILGYPLITDNFPANTLTASGAIIAGEQVRIDNTYYQFTAGSVDAGAPAGTAANPWLVALGGDVAAALLNLFEAIGGTGAAGVDYSTALTAHASVDANGITATTLSVTAKISTASAIVTSETGANLAWAGATLVLGPTDPSFISAGSPPPAAAVFTMTDLPPDVTSVRALLPIYRGQKTDGGDCNIQSGLSPDNAAWVNGADQPQTVAFNFWWSVIHTNPDTAAPWTPGEVNGAFVRLNRTL